MTVITASPKGFQKLLSLQEDSLKTLSTMKDLMQKDADEMDGVRIQKQSADIAQQLLDVQTKSAQRDKDFYDDQKQRLNEQAKAIAEVAKGTKTFKTLGDKFKDLEKAFSTTFMGGNFTQTLMKAMNVGGVFDKRLAKGEFVKSQQAMGDTRSKKDIAKDFTAAQTATKALQATEKDIADLKKLLGKGQNVSDDQLAKSDKGRMLLDQRANQSAQLAKVDKTMGLFAGDQPSAALPLTPSDKGETPKSTSTKALEAATTKEDKNEMLKVLGSQTDILQQIANNTAAMAGKQTSAAGGKEDSGGAGGRGILGSIGAGLKSLGSGFAGLGRGVGQGIRGLLFGVAQGLAALANPATLVGLGALTLAMMGMGKAMQYAAPFMEALAPVLMKVADVIQNVFMTAIKAIPDVIKAVGDVISGTIGAISDAIVKVIDAVVGSVERLGKIDGNNLVQVGGGLLAVSAGLAAFGAANVIAGVGNLVSNLLTFGGDSPIDQLLKIADSGDGLMKAAQGMQAIADAMGSLAKIDKDSMKAINDFPWLKATAFVAAGGGMMMANGAKIYNASKENADSKAANDAKSGGTQTNVVNAPKINNSSTTNVIKPNIRNAESSQSRYLQTRY